MVRPRARREFDGHPSDERGDSLRVAVDGEGAGRLDIDEQPVAFEVAEP